MTSDLKTARSIFAKAVEKAQDILAKTPEMKALVAAQKQLSSFDSTFQASDETITPKGGVTASATVRRNSKANAAPVNPQRGKPGPKPKTQTAKAAATPQAPKAKSGPKAGTAKRIAKTDQVKAAAKNIPDSKIKEGRQAVLRGERPPLREAMAIVMGAKTLNSLQVYEALKARNWLPQGEDPRGYISMTFSKNAEMFERQGRGEYRVKEGSKKITNGASKRTTTAKASPTTDEALAELGITHGAVAENPFSDARA